MILDLDVHTHSGLFPRLCASPSTNTNMEDMELEDEIIREIPIRFSNKLDPALHIHQFPLLTRSLQPPPSAVASGKYITSRIKPHVRKIEIHVPADPRPDVWNSERAKQFGAAQVEDDREKNQEMKDSREGDPRLSDVRLRSEEVRQKGSYMLGIVRDGELLRNIHALY